jgi:hypothetical protein
MRTAQKLTALIITLALLLTLAPSAFAAEHWDWDTEGHYDISWYSRTGTSFTLTTAEQLAGLAYIVNQSTDLQLPGETVPLRETFTGKTVKLGADVELNSRSYTQENASAHQWPSIGGGIHTEANAVFNGTFDGQNHTISNLYIHNLTAWTEYDARNRGLFGITAENAIIENVILTDGFIRAARSTGGIVGKTGYLNASEEDPKYGYDDSLSGHGTIIRNCHNVNTTVITTDSKGVGGIVGACWNFALVQNCSNSGSISSIGSYPAGGIAGESEYIIENCYNSGEISSAGNNAGGIVGSNKLATSEMRNCYNVGKISGAFAGGLAGYQVGLSSNSYNAGAIIGTTAGGLFGEVKSGQVNANLYFLSSRTSSAAGLDKDNALKAKALTVAELQALTINEAFTADKANINNGYPVLSWQTEQVVAANNTRPSYTDVSATDWYFEAVSYVTDKGLFDSASATAFAPNAPMTRAMLAVALYRLDGAVGNAADSGFTDVAANTELAASVAWAVGAGVTNGAGGSTFSPDGEITREQIAAMLFRYATYKHRNTTTSGDLTAFADADSVSDYALDAITWAVGAGIINGSDGRLDPQGTATRAQVATMVMRFAQ